MEGKLHPQDLRLGNYVMYEGKIWSIVKLGYDDLMFIKVFDDSEELLVSCKNIEPIQLTEDFLLKCPQIEFNSKSIIMKSYNLDLGRNRHLSISDIGTPNGFIWLCYREEKEYDSVCIYNFDYDGNMYLHQFQNLVKSITGQELTINL